MHLLSEELEKLVLDILSKSIPVLVEDLVFVHGWSEHVVQKVREN